MYEKWFYIRYKSMCCKALIAGAGIAMIVVASLGLAGHLSLYDTSLGTLIPAIFSLNIPAIVASSLGIAGQASMAVVAGISIAFGALLVIATSSCCV